MKTIKILMILLIIGTFNSYAGGVKSVEVSNGVILLRSEGHIKWIYAIDEEKRNMLNKDKHLLLYDLELYTDGNEKQYCLRMGIQNIPSNIFSLKFPGAFIPTYAKLLLKMHDDSVVELTSIQNKEFGIIQHLGYFAIDEKVLHKLFEGVKKIRLELINFNPETGDVQKEFRDGEYKKDKLGKELKEAYEDLNKEYAKKEEELLKKIKVSTMTDINEGF